MFRRINGVGMTNDLYVPLLTHTCQAAVVDFVHLIEAWIEFVSFFREFPSSIIEFAIWYAVFSDLRSLVPT